MPIRLIEERDIPAVVAMMHRNWDSVMAKHHSPAVVAESKRQVTPCWVKAQMRRKQVFVVETESGIVATGALANFGTRGAPRYGVSQFCVRPDLHGRGLGKSLLDHLVRLARSQDIARLHVPSSRNAIPFYGRMGFTVDDVQSDTADEITWMTMELKGSEPALLVEPPIDYRRSP